MKLNDVMQQLAVTSVNKVEQKPQPDTLSVRETVPVSQQAVATATSRVIDMRNISPNEYSELVRAGITELPAPMLLPLGIFDLYGRRADLSDQKVDYLAQLEQSLMFNESIGDVKSAAFLRERLAIVNALHGKTVTSAALSQGIDEQI